MDGLRHRNSYIPFLLSFLIFAIFELFFLWPQFVYYLLSLLFVFTFLGLWRLNGLTFGVKIRDAKFWWFFIVIWIFTMTGYIFTVFLQTPYLLHIVALFVSFFSFLYLREVFKYFCKPLISERESLLSISHFLNTSSIFFVSVALFAALVLLNLSLSIAVIVVMVVVFGLVFQFLWLRKNDIVKNALFSLIVSLMLVELFWSLMVLPIGFYVLGLFLTLVYHILVNIVQLWLSEEEWNFKFVKRYIIIGVIISILLFTTTQWK